LLASLKLSELLISLDLSIENQFYPLLKSCSVLGGAEDSEIESGYSRWLNPSI
jgi:hypothetical protein